MWVGTSSASSTVGSDAPRRRTHGAPTSGVLKGAGGAALPTLASLFGATGLLAETFPAPADAVSSQLAAAGFFREGLQSAAAQVLKVVSVLQERLQESEAAVLDLQSQADALEEKRRSWVRRTERAERDSDAAAQRSLEVERSAKSARLEAAPLMERFMEAQVLRSQLPNLEADVARLREDMAACQEELEQGWPRLIDAEDAEAQCAQAAADLESSHATEMAVLRSSHLEEMADMRSRHATSMAEVEAARQEEVSGVKVANVEELGRLKAALENAQWQADVYVREQHDSVREICLRQRENSRLAKRLAEARQEALELTVRLDAMRASTEGAPAREAELQAIRTRCALLERTAAEWRDALERKELDCKSWRRRALQHSTSEGDPVDETFEDEEAQHPTTRSARDAHGPDGLGHSRRPGPQPDEVPALDVSNPSSPGHLTPVPPASPSLPSQIHGHARQTSPSTTWSGVPTPARTPYRAPGVVARHTQQPLLPQQPRRQRQPAPKLLEAPPPLPIAEASEAVRGGAGGPGPLVLAPPQPVEEFLAVAIRAARLHAEAEAVSAKLAGVAQVLDDPGGAVRGGQQQVVASGALVLGSDVRSDQERHRAINIAALDAENELEMLTFLLSDVDAREAEQLLEDEATRQPPLVAARLRLQLGELASRGRTRDLSSREM